jgi:hypothetical protein
MVVLQQKSLVPVDLAVLRRNAASESCAVSQLLRLLSSVRRQLVMSMRKSPCRVVVVGHDLSVVCAGTLVVLRMQMVVP